MNELFLGKQKQNTWIEIIGSIFTNSIINSSNPLLSGKGHTHIMRNSIIQTKITELSQLQTMINYSGNSLTIDDSSIKIENGYSESFNDAKQKIDIFTTQLL